MVQFERFFERVELEDVAGAIEAGLAFTDSQERLECFLRDGISQIMKSADTFPQDGTAIWREHSRSEIVNLVVANLRLSVEGYYVRNRKGTARVLVVCPEGETHDLGAKVMAQLMRVRGFNACFFGPDLPSEQLLTLTEVVKPAAVVFSVTHHYNKLALQEAVDALRQRFAHLMIIAGGAALGRDETDLKGAYVTQNPETLFEWIRGELR